MTSAAAMSRAIVTPNEPTRRYRVRAHYNSYGPRTEYHIERRDFFFWKKVMVVIEADKVQEALANIIELEGL